MEKPRRNLYECLLAKDVDEIIIKLARILELKSRWVWSTHETDEDEQEFCVEGRCSAGPIILRAFFDGPKNFSTTFITTLELEIDINDVYYINIRRTDDLCRMNNSETMTSKIWQQMLVEAYATEKAEERAREETRQAEILATKQAEAKKILDYLGRIGAS